MSNDSADNEQASVPHKQHDLLIRVVLRGPYRISGTVPLDIMIIRSNPFGIALSWEKGKTFQAAESYSLCRCGKSKRKPWCDNSHVAEAFEGADQAEHVPFFTFVTDYRGEALTLHDANIFCAGARFCDRAGGIWSLIERSEDSEAKATALQEIADCPSGRLVAINKDGSAIEPALPISISLIEDPAAGCSGPLWVKGGIPVIGTSGAEYEKRNRVTLCRCGKSCNKPFCDGAHMAGEFKTE